MTVPTLGLTEAQALTALRTFLLGVLPAGLEVVRGEVNRVAEPIGANFVVMWPVGQRRLETNETSYYDNILSGSIAGTTLTVSAISQVESPLAAGVTLIDETGALAANTVIQTQLTGPAGGVGTYSVLPSQTVASETMYAGVRVDLTQTELVVQLDVHGPSSGDNIRIIESLFRSEYATAAFAASSAAVVPLYCGEPKQTPFVNAEQQYEYRWTVEAHLQINPVVGTPQQFADQIQVTTIAVDTTYPP